MTETETPPGTEGDKTLSTKVDQETYDWFIEHARENFRNISGQLAYVIDTYVRRHKAGKGFADAVVAQGATLPPLRPYIGDRDPQVTVRWDTPADPGPVGTFEPDDDPEEGVR